MGRETNEFPLNVSRAVAEALLFVTASLFAVLALVEFSAREAASSFLRARQTQVLSRLAQLQGTASNSSEALKDGQVLATCLDNLETELGILAINGSTEENRLGSIIRWASNGCNELSNLNAPFNTPLDGVVNAAVSYILLPQRLVERLGSEHLVALSVLMAGILGVFVADLRRRTQQTVQRLLLGLSTGLLVFLGVKGGKVLFLMGGGDGIAVDLNPYGASFLAFMAGLFSERAFELLSEMVDTLMERLRGAAPVRSEGVDGGAEGPGLGEEGPANSAAEPDGSAAS